MGLTLKWKSLPSPRGFSIMSLGPSLPLAPCSTRERQSTRAKHRSRVVVITREARGRAPRVLTAPFGLDRSPADDGPNGQCWRKHRISYIFTHKACGRTKGEITNYSRGRRSKTSIDDCGEHSHCAAPEEPEDLHDSRPSPRTESLAASADQWAERIMRKIDCAPK
jgi:hypothetical protein